VRLRYKFSPNPNHAILFLNKEREVQKLPSTENPPGCFLAGTRIAAPDGTVCVEDLTVGALVLTASGKARPVRWLGSSGFDCTRYPNPAVVWPICIQAGAFAENQPARDLWISPGHAILVDNLLIPAEKLVNGATIAQVPRERVEYWHLEVENEHDILLAEGLPTEVYLNNGKRTAFVNGAKHGNKDCVPLVLDGPAVHHAFAALLARAKALGYVMTEDPDVHIIADGKRTEPVRLSEKRLAFMLAAAVSSIELRSHSFVPAHGDSANRDYRSLGIRIDRLQIDGTEVSLKDEAAFARGWYGVELPPGRPPMRWSRDPTPLPAGTRLVVIDICGRGRYLAKPRSAVIAEHG